MSDEYDPWRVMQRLFQGLGRVCLVMLLYLTFMLAFGAFAEANPDEAAEIDAAMHLVDIAGQPITVLDPVTLGVMAWSLGPFVAIIGEFLRKEGVFQAIRDWRGEKA